MEKEKGREFSQGDRVWVNYENSNGTVVEVRAWRGEIDSVLVQVDSDNVVLDCSPKQLEDERVVPNFLALAVQDLS